MSKREFGIIHGVNGDAAMEEFSAPSIAAARTEGYRRARARGWGRNYSLYEYEYDEEGAPTRCRQIVSGKAGRWEWL